MKVKRQIIKIDNKKCNGCGLCAKACHEGAIEMIDGKAKLIRDDYCDGLGNCLPVCPTGAITFEEREAAPFDEQAVKAQMEKKAEKLPCGCPSHNIKMLERKAEEKTAENLLQQNIKSQLRQFPIQLQLVPFNAPYFENADLLIAADCVAFAYGDFHNKFIKNKITLIGCPKLDSVDYSEKLTQILENNQINSLTVVRMEVPCCGGIVVAVKEALKRSGKIIPWNVVTISREGNVL